MEVNRRNTINGTNFVEGCIYEVYDKISSVLEGIYFYPTKYPKRIIFENNRFFNNTSGKYTLILKKLDHNIPPDNNKYIKFDKNKIYGKPPVLTSANLVRANLVDADLTGAVLIKANLFRADLTGAVLTEANLFRAVLHLCTFKMPIF